VRKNLRLDVLVPPEAEDRIRFLMRVLSLPDRDELVARALRWFDRAVCPCAFEGARVVVELKGGAREDLSPCGPSGILDEGEDENVLDF
jgi:hypothetical protein